MNSRQRILNVVAGQPVDRPAVAPFLHVNFVKEHRRSNDVDPVAETIAVYEEFGFDLIHRNCTPLYDDLTIEGPDWKPEISETGNAEKQIVTVTVQTPGGELRRVVQSSKLYEYEWSCFLIEPPVKSPADLDLFMHYQPPVPTIDTADIVRAGQLVGEKGIVAPWVQGAFNEIAYLLRGHAVLLDPLEDEGFYRSMISYFLGRNLEKIRQFTAAGAEFISVGANEANGTAVGPDYFRRYIFEYERQLMESLHAFGGRAIYHNCGRAALLLPILREIGMDVYESLTPPPFGDTDLAEAARIMSGRGLMGGMDQIDFLRKATPDMIRRRGREMVEIALRHGRYILGTSDYINEGTPTENLHALRAAVE
jgi:uroporphyrinogen decarboxylase